MKLREKEDWKVAYGDIFVNGITEDEIEWLVSDDSNMITAFSWEKHREIHKNFDGIWWECGRNKTKYRKKLYKVFDKYLIKTREIKENDLKWI